jgi:hypothetical protein
MSISAAAQVQRRLWGTDPRAWADLAEAHNQPPAMAALTCRSARRKGQSSVRRA